MKKTLLIVLLCFAFQANYSQESYTIDGETLELKTEIEGKLDLLWNIIDGEYRYFVRTENGTITELKNTKDSNKNYLEEYKTTLSSLTNGMSTDQLKLTTYSLKKFIDKYNASVDSSYATMATEGKVQFRLGFSAGITNHPFVRNPDNVKVPQIAAELEIYEAELPRHSGFLQAKHTFDAEDFNYSTNEFSLGYRYRIINKPCFSIYGQVKLATVNFISSTFEDENNIQVSSNEAAFDVPLIFGIGSDIKIGKNSFITLIYGELFAIIFDNQGNFSTDIAIGYKFNL
ncbi:hypothetical protein [uncultured Winogradskyella sp.]|uniref:hypothetical protein n=1 Tax=uncultured Winogradskyella sp. TaxID=395353 RepID=UPI00260B07D4|nr:hypothetical protein [uncultured Winogradskyella sp.]